MPNKINTSALEQIINDSDPSPCESSLLHSYPASMPAFLASRLIENYSSPGDTVFDPFCGTGVVVLEGIRLGRHCIGTDLQETAIRILNASLNIPQTTDLLAAWDKVHENAYYSSGLFGNHQNISLSHNLTLLQPWFHAKTFEGILSIHAEILKISSLYLREILLLLLAGSLLSLSKRHIRGSVHWGWVADNVVPKNVDLIYVDPFVAIKDRLTKLVNFVNSIDSSNIINKSKFKALLYQHNWIGKENNITNITVGPVDLILTSPPYPYSIDYSLALRLTHYLLGYDFHKIRKFEIGARYKRKRKSRVDDYLSELGCVLKQVSNYVKKEGYFVLILPDPSGYPDMLNFDSFLWMELLRSKLEGRWVLNEFSTRLCGQRRVVNKKQQIRSELVAVFQRK